jgi:hypothetical protein
MPSSAATRRSCPGPVRYPTGSAETVADVIGPARYLPELLGAAGMTLKRPAAVTAAEVGRLVGFWGAVRAAGERAIGLDSPGPIAIPRGNRWFSDPAYQGNPASPTVGQPEVGSAGPTRNRRRFRRGNRYR